MGEIDQAQPSAVERPLLELQELQPHRPGSVLFREGDAPHGVYIIHSGAVDLLIAARKGADVPLQVAGAGQIVGLSSIISARPHDSTAVVRIPSELGYVQASKLMEWLARDPGAWFGVIQFLSEDVSSCWDSMRRLTTPRP